MAARSLSQRMAPWRSVRKAGSSTAGVVELPLLSVVNKSATFVSHLWEIELLLSAARSMAQATPWVLGADFPAVPAAEIEAYRRLVRECRHAAPTRRQDVPAVYTKQLTSLSTAIMATLFNWHCATFSPVHTALDDAEQRYLRAVFAAFAGDQFRWGGWGEAETWTQHYKLSPFSYSHRIKGQHLNSSRVAMGVSSTAPDPTVVALARRVMEAKGARDCLDLMDRHPDTIFFYGLGWDIEAKAFRAYVFNTDITQLPEHVARSVPALQPRARWPEAWDTAQHSAYSLQLEQIRRQAVVSYAYKQQRDGSFQRVEEKVYIYPTEDQLPLLPNLPPGVKEVAFMFSSDRGVVEQFDVAHEEPYPYHASADWRGRLNGTGQRVYDAFAAHGLALDTIAYTSPEDHTLYFPMS
eukprot:EG_transcript_12270